MRTLSMAGALAGAQLFFRSRLLMRGDRLFVMGLLTVLTLTATAGERPDPHSFSRPDQVAVTHLALNLTADFSAKSLRGSATLTLQRHADAVDTLILDTRDLTIKGVQAEVDGRWQDTGFELQPEDAILGQALHIDLPATAAKVRVDYHSQPEASGLQWLNPEQTAGRQQPFLFSQSQAIHARSWVPLQDTPQVRFTYSARIKTPPGLKAVMSAENDPQDQDGDYQFNMPQPIPSYLMALAVGELRFQAMSERTAVYAEPSVLAAAAAEFEDTEKMMQAVEARYGAYRWGRYDLLILPPSFPFGGMENPRLSFITPTVIAGDKSLVALIAHELAHSWSGNLVTNATWGDLWLNEGFTTYLERRIMEDLFGERRARMEAVLGYQSLEEDLAKTPERDTHLALDVAGRNPDHVFNDVAYEKGRLFLVWLEHCFGRERFDSWLQGYFERHAFKTMTTPGFLADVQTHLLERYPDVVTLAQINAWIAQPGLPAGHPVPQSDAFERINAMRDDWLNGKTAATDLTVEEWTTHEWVYFLNNLPRDIGAQRMSELDAAFDLTQSGNSEIAHSWLLLAIKNQYQPAYSRLHHYLTGIGRRRLVQPLYEALLETPTGQEMAKRIYREARPGYHPLLHSSMDPLIAALQ